MTGGGVVHPLLFGEFAAGHRSLGFTGNMGPVGHVTAHRQARVEEPQRLLQMRPVLCDELVDLVHQAVDVLGHVE
jgi:hypothetical protein